MNNKKRNLLITKYALYSLGILLLFSFISQLLGNGIGLILFIVLGAEMALCCNEYKRETGEELNYREAFTIGWQVAFITGLLNGTLVLVIVAFGEQIFLDEISKYKSTLRAQSVVIDETALDNIIKFITNPWILFGLTLVFYTFIGFLISSIMAFFVKTTDTSTNNEEQY